MANRSLSIDGFPDASDASSDVAIHGDPPALSLPASSQQTEIITRSYNPQRKFWQNVPKIEEEKAKETLPTIKVRMDLKEMRAKAIAEMNPKDGKVTLKTTFKPEGTSGSGRQPLHNTEKLLRKTSILPTRWAGGHFPAALGQIQTCVMYHVQA